MVAEVINSLTHGVDIGFSSTVRASNTPNMKSALENRKVIDATLTKEVQSGWSAGPFSSPPFDPFVINSIGVVPKKNGGHRMITDLSRPDDSVNAHINKEQFSMIYSRVDDATAILSQLGDTALINVQDGH